VLDSPLHFVLHLTSSGGQLLQLPLGPAGRRRQVLEGLHLGPLLPTPTFSSPLPLFPLSLSLPLSCPRGVRGGWCPLPEEAEWVFPWLPSPHTLWCSASWPAPAAPSPSQARPSLPRPFPVPPSLQRFSMRNLRSDRDG